MYTSIATCLLSAESAVLGHAHRLTATKVQELRLLASDGWTKQIHEGWERDWDTKSQDQKNKL